MARHPRPWVYLYGFDPNELPEMHVQLVREGIMSLVSPKVVDVSSLCLPEDGRYSITSRAFTLLTRFRLGMPLDAVEHRVCPGCSCDMDS